VIERASGRTAEPRLTERLSGGCDRLCVAHGAPLGLKGAGEGGTIAAIAALLSAVEDALEPFGVRVAEAPITPERTVELIGASAA
jgi:hypothetical protein